ncbi:MAG: GtrA family protein [Parcubacteria group bacterium GW2011_GWD2_43_10]|uniref:GtrA/DPMS transmembrane domain-containing protein n=4 Tax=Candidatus Vebleniibacteriota TaxID=1817921 RepID=A0A1G2Q7Q2_9BACT|nr:MAG: GtrA family protein [Parcubacteria group bacterium GW2011_GWA2_42_80]KKS82908.1 MAG: GtrA family protein [Parcubacteria group bacterium GW2011_GWD2_43_10]KKS92817.1 MAG: GtrA family protein [Parcubacteria group bacterium GW2011_GWE2_43_12]KKT12319.1 MAG: GtrA family protein [Parcubacteria group bacterium GW2011_GWA1_43_27]KKT16838.1 MAG: GtrA family protein [Parcubacteria group bacterium GW2011_GWB1_43_66]KKT20920.1 MAG: GtrA family protein [Parcubacteria group bacterium GW2011_GWE1_43
MSEVAQANIVRRKLVGELWRFLTIGTINATVDFLVYLSLTRGFDYWAEHYLQANFFAFLIANFNSFIWNKFWTFSARQGNPFRQYLEFLSVSLVYLAFIQAGLWLLVSRWGVFDLVAKVVVIGLGMFVYFVVLRHWVFWRPRKPEPRV